MTNETPALGICLEEYEYPYPVQFLTLGNDLQPLKMAYMDVPPGEKPNGKTVVLNPRWARAAALAFQMIYQQPVRYEYHLIAPPTLT